MRESARAAVSYVNVVLAFASIVAFATISEYIFRVVGMTRTEVNSLTGTLLGLSVPIIVIAVMFGVGSLSR